MKNKLNCHQSKTHNMAHFLEVCLLIILSKQSGYGYDLMLHLPNYGFTKEELNIGSLYRVLRKMENRKLISSKWVDSTKGPNKRIYHINDLGKRELSSWVDILKKRRNKITFVIDEYHKIKGN